MGEDKPQINISFEEEDFENIRKLAFDEKKSKATIVRTRIRKSQKKKERKGTRTMIFDMSSGDK